METANLEFEASLPFWVSIFLGENPPPRVRVVGFTEKVLKLKCEFYEGPEKEIELPLEVTGVNDCKLEESNLLEVMERVQNKAFDNYRVKKLGIIVWGLVLNILLPLCGFELLRELAFGANEPEGLQDFRMLLDSYVGKYMSLGSFYFVCLVAHFLEGLYVVHMLRTRLHVHSSYALAKMFVLTCLLGWPMTSIVVNMVTRKNFILKQR